ncbi:hypothetical protein BCON_0062g00400 [Botryotinia convoluta]|uniref:2EXR domain-containing protein n=1 Tax=Botryotinia convoluta TaxID=54673 RepID=A0A4Z1IFA7_9HELO|nr:hypothetical protein BCON_0062g00400 [Botryotinia convoluta]
MAGASRIAVTGFPLFMNLAIELRSQICRDTLPDTIEPALYRHKYGCWRLLHLTESDPYGQYDPLDDTENIRLEFCHNMLDNVQIKTPLISVNHEAREIAVKWANTKGFVVKNIEGYPIFSCPFNPGRDILYIPPNKEVTFLMEPFDKLGEPDLANQDPLLRTFVKNFAITESTLRKHDRSFESFLGHIFDCFSPIGMVVIVIDTPPGVRFADRDLNLQERWELIKGGGYDWDNEKESWEFHGSKFSGKEGLYRLLEEKKDELKLELAYYDIPNFKIQVASAIRR